MTELQITQFELPSGFIDLGMGNPDLALLPLDALRQSSENFFAQKDPRPLQYGIEQGSGYFRQGLADFLTDAYGAEVDPRLLFITSGASSALDLICSLMTRPGDVVFAEEPSYFLALRIFEDHGLRVVPVPMDDDGLDLDALEDLLSDYSPKFLYTIPTFQNPSGRTLPLERRERLVALAQRFEFHIVADEVYHLLTYGQAPPMPFAQFAQDVEQVISINSFSKIMAPGLRLGWVQAHPKVIQRMAGCGLLDSGGGMNPFTSALVTNLIQSGDLARNIAKIRGEYASRRKVLDESLRRYLHQAEYTPPEGGFFFWVRLPGIDTEKLRPKARENKIDYRPGVLFSSQGKLHEYMRMSFCVHCPEEIEEGVVRLAECIRNTKNAD